MSSPANIAFLGSSSPYLAQLYVPEIEQLIFDQLTLASLWILAFTSTSNLARVQGYLQLRMSMLCARFGVRWNDISNLLAQTDRQIIGATAMRAVLPVSVDDGHTFDIGVGSEDAQETFHDFFTNVLGLVHHYDEHQGWRSPVIHTYRRPNENTPRIQVLMYEDQRRLQRSAFRARNTALMNWISRDGIFIGYPGLLHRSIVARVSVFLASLPSG